MGDDDDASLTMLENEDAGKFYQRQIHHRDTVTYKTISIAFGLFFFVGSIIFFFMDAKKFFLPILFYDIVGTTMLVYGLNLSDFEKKKKRHEDDLENLEKDLQDKKFEMQF
ncbi:hypothetical protein JXM83_06255 [Candidatus Woesearchaeota archaeon]|nr:hypothetical protein [Candidatus Woesearchaeota archaeon]